MATAAALPPDSAPEAVAESLRTSLQIAAPEHAELVIATLVDAMQSRKPAWGRCKRCEETVKVEVLDATAAVNAVKVLLEQAEGRPGTAGDVTQSATLVRRVGRAGPGGPPQT